MRRMTQEEKADAGSDPAIVATLLEPILRLRESLGPGGVDTAGIAEALRTAQRAAISAETPGRVGVHALESTQTAPQAVPVIRRTDSEVAALAQHTETLSTLLADAVATRDAAANRLDAIIADFRRRARPMAAAATSQADADAIISVGAQSLRDAVSTINHARGDMDGHRRQAVAHGEAGPRVTVPEGYQSLLSSNTGDSDADSSSSSSATPSSSRPSSMSTDDDTTSSTTSTGTGTSAGTGMSTGASPSTSSSTSTGMGGGADIPMTPIPPGTDPRVAAEIALNNALVQGGVSLGTSAIDGGVEIGSKVVEGITEVATHGIDTGAGLAEQGITALAPGADPDATTDPAASPGSPTGPGSGSLFGGLGAGAGPTAPEPSAPPNSSGGGPFAGLGAGPPRNDPPKIEPGPEQASPPPPPATSQPAPPPTESEPEPTDEGSTGTSEDDAAAADEPPPPTGAVVPPMGRAPSEQPGLESDRPRRGQLGMTPGGDRVP